MTQMPYNRLSWQAPLDLLCSFQEQKSQILWKLVPYKALKIFHLTHPVVLEALFNCSIQAGNFPTLWTFEKALMIPKPEKDSLCAERYRPIILLPTAGKVLERLIVAQLHTYMDENAPLHDCQYDFRRNHSCEEAVNAAVNRIQRFLKYYKLVAVISLDIKGTFDNARWCDILKQLRF